MNETAPDMMTADVMLDTIGHYCPMPIIFTAKKIKQMQAGQVLLVLSGDPGVKKDMEAWCHNTGHDCLRIEIAGGIYRCYVRKAH